MIQTPGNILDGLTIFNGVLDCPQTIPDSIFDLCEGVFVGSLHQQGDGAGVATVLDECELLLSLQTGWGQINNSASISYDRKVYLKISHPVKHR